MDNRFERDSGQHGRYGAGNAGGKKIFLLEELLGDFAVLLLFGFIHQG